MPGLSPEQIAAIYKRKEEQAAAAPKRGGKRKAVDLNDRSYQAWFVLEHTDPGEEFCDNPECLDPRGKKHASPVESAEQVVALVVTEEAGVNKMCRYCFTMGWLTKRENSEQQTLAVG